MLDKVIKSSSVLGCPLEEVGDRRVLVKLTSMLDRELLLQTAISPLRDK